MFPPVKSGQAFRPGDTAADLVERSVSETLTYYAFPDVHWQMIRNNNPLERIMREIRRRTRFVGAFPDGQSRLNLAAHATLPAQVFYIREIPSTRTGPSMRQSPRKWGKSAPN